jgi:hypothetical protein
MAEHTEQEGFVPSCALDLLAHGYAMRWSRPGWRWFYQARLHGIHYKTRHSTRPASRQWIIPVPGRELLNPQAEPDCEFTTTDPKADERQKLDYERQCYRHAEMIVRSPAATAGLGR